MFWCYGSWNPIKSILSLSLPHPHTLSHTHTCMAQLNAWSGSISSQLQMLNSYKLAEIAFIRKMKLLLIYIFLHLVILHIISSATSVFTFHVGQPEPTPLTWCTHTKKEKIGTQYSSLLYLYATNDRNRCTSRSRRYVQNHPTV